MQAMCNPRYHMWCRLISNYAGMQAREKLLAKHNYTKFPWNEMQPSCEDHMRAETNMQCITVMGTNPINFDCCNAAVPEAHPSQWRWTTPGKQEEEKEEVMYDDFDMDTQRDYLNSRLHLIRENKNQAAKKQFGMRNDPTPTNAGEYIERVQKGLFVLADDMKKCGFHAIEWRDPAIKKDPDGYEAAKGLIEKAFIAVKDQVMIAPAMDALKAVQEFEAS